MKTGRRSDVMAILTTESVVAAMQKLILTTESVVATM